MKNKKDILNRVLLNMKYDPKKTLLEQQAPPTWADDVIGKKKPTITVDPAEMGTPKLTIKDLSPDGSDLILPRTAKVLSRHSSNDKPLGIDRYCNYLLSKNDKLDKNKVQECLQLVEKKYLEKTKDKSVASFQAYGKTFKSCWSLAKNQAVIPLESNNFFNGYFTSCNPVGESYIPPTPKPQPPTAEDEKTGTTTTWGQEGGLDIEGKGDALTLYLRGSK